MPSNSKYSGKKAIITGGTAGIGLATAKVLVEGGAEVLVTGTTEKNLEAARRQLGPDAIVVRSDAGKVTDVDELTAIVAGKLGSVDLVFLNAGYTKLEPFEQVTEAEYDKVFDINTKGVFFAVQRLVPLVSRGGSFLFMSRTSSDIPA
jgi:NAD(P)-dependent dehydrogenase (short-subunit alcohol dehydrogenase family)